MKNKIIKKSIIIFTLFLNFLSYCQTSSDYYDKGKEKDSLKDYQGAIENYSKAIELEPKETKEKGLDPEYDNINTYYNLRGNSKFNLKDYKGAIYDHTKSINIKPNDPFIFMTYTDRAQAKFALEDYRGAILDCNKAIELMPNLAIQAYFFRGCLKTQLKDYYSAIDDFNKIINLEPGIAEVYYRKGIAILYLKQKNLACLEFSKAGELGYETAYDMIKEFCK
jgi:tetratricopeptide (TPR) repeat protein